MCADVAGRDRQMQAHGQTGAAGCTCTGSAPSLLGCASQESLGGHAAQVKLLIQTQ